MCARVRTLLNGYIFVFTSDQRNANPKYSETPFHTNRHGRNLTALGVCAPQPAAPAPLAAPRHTAQARPGAGAPPDAPRHPRGGPRRQPGASLPVPVLVGRSPPPGPLCAGLVKLVEVVICEGEAEGQSRQLKQTRRRQSNTEMIFFF